MSLPNPGMDAVPFTPLTAEFVDNMIENIEALADGSGLNSNATISSGLLSNPYKFSVYHSTSQASGNGTLTKTTFNTELFDTNNNFASSTYTVPISGFYWFGGRVELGGSTAARILCSVMKNSVEVLRGHDFTLASGSLQTPASSKADGLLQCSAGDTVELWNLVNATVTLAGSRAECYFQGFLVSKA